jgi:hypothetical protein
LGVDEGGGLGGLTRGVSGGLGGDLVVAWGGGASLGVGGGGDLMCGLGGGGEMAASGDGGHSSGHTSGSGIIVMSSLRGGAGAQL